MVPGAAGGPKAVGISGLDQAIFGRFLPEARRPRTLIGASIGSWRFAAVAGATDGEDAADPACAAWRSSTAPSGFPKASRPVKSPAAAP